MKCELQQEGHGSGGGALLVAANAFGKKKETGQKKIDEGPRRVGARKGGGPKAKKNLMEIFRLRRKSSIHPSRPPWWAKTMKFVFVKRGVFLQHIDAASSLATHR